MKTGYEIEPPVEHFLQRDIIQTLMKSASASFSQLKPKEVESNLFMYHLRRLMARGLVEKTDNGYCLSARGKAYVDRVSRSTLNLRLQPKMVTILAVQHSSGKWLMLEHLRQPHLGTIGYPSGKIHYQEDLHAAAIRELKEKTNLTGIELSLRGNVMMRFYRSDEVANHICGYVFFGNFKGKDLPTFETESFRTFWDDEERLFGPSTFKGNKEVSELLKKPSPFIESYDFLSE